MQKVCRQGRNEASCKVTYDAPECMFFWWGRKKDGNPPAPIHLVYQELKKSGYGSDELVGQEDQRQIPPSQDCFGEAGVDQMGSETWEERLQEKIRFVFSHEQEGLLAIGTFALDQLAGVTALPHLDVGRQIKTPPAPDHNVNSRRNSVSDKQVVIREVRSSDDVIEPQPTMRSPIAAACKKTESYPVFGDHEAVSSVAVIHCRGALSVESSPKLVTANNHPSPNANITVYKEPGIKQVLPATTPPSDQYVNADDFYSPGVCGLFASRSRRTKKGVKERRKKPPEKPNDNDGDFCEELKKAASRGSLRSYLGRLWRTGFSVSSKVTPEKSKLSSSPSRADQTVDLQAQAPPCIASVDDVGEGQADSAPPGVDPKPLQVAEVTEQRKRRGHSFGKAWASCAHNGKWIRTDSEFVVLEM